MTITLECAYEPPHVHDYPDDWVFGGPTGQDPRCDPRWVTRRSTYIYLDDHFDRVWITQTPLCEDQAIDEFTRWGQDGAVYLQAIRPNGETELLKWQYDRASDTVAPVGA